MYHYLYKTTCVITNKYYYGMHTTHNIDDGYIGSGIVLRNSIAKYGLDFHIKTIIRFCNSREELAAQEALLITEDTLTDPLCMNLKKGGRGGGQKGIKRSSETRAKMTAAKAKLKADGWKPSPESVSKRNAKAKGRKASLETKLKMSMSRKNKKLPPFSLEHRQKLSIARRKRVTSEETKAKISNTLKKNGSHKPWNLSPEAREKQILATKKSLTNKPKILVVCPYCAKQGGKPAMMRFHFEYCKNKKDT